LAELLIGREEIGQQHQISRESLEGMIRSALVVQIDFQA